MPAPLVGIAVATAARLAAKKLAQQGAKKVAKTAASRARANSAAATKATKTTKTVISSKSGIKKAPHAMVGQTIKISSDPTRKVIKQPVLLKKKAAVKPMSYNQLKDMPNLIKVDSAKGNAIKKIAYRKRTSN